MNLYKKLISIMSEVGAIEKKGYNSFSKYEYVRAVDVINGFQKLLIKHGVFLSITEEECDRWQVEKSGGFNYFCKIRCRATFINAEEPKETHEVSYYSISSDTLDKDIFKAKTNGLKYLLTQNFMVVTDLLIDTEEDKTPTKETKKFHYPRFGMCTTCGDGWLLKSKNGDKLYCSRFRDGCTSSPVLFNGQTEIPEEIDSKEKYLEMVKHGGR